MELAKLPQVRYNSIVICDHMYRTLVYYDSVHTCHKDCYDNLIRMGYHIFVYVCVIHVCLKEYVI